MKQPASEMQTAKLGNAAQQRATWVDAAGPLFSLSPGPSPNLLI